MNSQYRKNLKAFAESCKKYIDEQLNGGNKMILEVASITGLTNSQCQDLSCGDVVVENNNGVKTTYIVFGKTTTTMSLTYVDSANSKEVKYEVSNNAWAYDETTNVKKLYHHYFDLSFVGHNDFTITFKMNTPNPDYYNALNVSNVKKIFDDAFLYNARMKVYEDSTGNIYVCLFDEYYTLNDDTKLNFSGIGYDEDNLFVKKNLTIDFTEFDEIEYLASVIEV